MFRGQFLSAALVVTALCNYPPILSAGLIAAWDFNESSGTVAHDSVGSVNGVLINGATFDPGAGLNGSGALWVDPSTNGYVSMGNNFAFGSGSFSIEAWVKTNPGETLGMFAVAKHFSGFGNGYFLAVNNVGDGAGGTSKAHFFDSGLNSGASSTTVNDGQWHQLVGVYNTGSGLAQIFVDGNLESSASLTGISTTSVPFLVGGVAASGTSTNGFRGLIDNVKVFDNALTAADVSAEYTTALAGAVPEPSSLMLLGLGGIGLSIGTFRRQRAARNLIGNRGRRRRSVC